jgi:hypothetical protein
MERMKMQQLLLQVMLDEAADTLKQLMPVIIYVASHFSDSASYCEFYFRLWTFTTLFRLALGPTKPPI